MSSRMQNCGIQQQLKDEMLVDLANAHDHQLCGAPTGLSRRMIKPQFAMEGTTASDLVKSVVSASAEKQSERHKNAHSAALQEVEEAEVPRS